MDSGIIAAIITSSIVLIGFFVSPLGQKLVNKLFESPIPPTPENRHCLKDIAKNSLMWYNSVKKRS